MNKTTKIILIVALVIFISVGAYMLNEGRKSAQKTKNYINELEKMVNTYVTETTTGLKMTDKPANLSKHQSDIFDMLKNETEVLKKWKSKDEIATSHLAYMKANSKPLIKIWL